MRVVQLNLAADFGIATAEELLDRYHTLTGWADALSDAGADVSVVQRYSRAKVVRRHNVAYHFVADGDRPMLPTWGVSAPSLECVRASAPDAVHVNGLMFPGMSHALRAALPGAVIVLQDHSGHIPRPGRLTRSLTARRWGRAFAKVDACLFTAAELASRWHNLGLPPDVPILEIAEASTTLTPKPRAAARMETGVFGSPAILWVGRFTPDKDPATVLAAFAMARHALPEAQLWMVVPAEADAHSLHQTIAANTLPAECVHIRGPIPHADMASFYSAGDLLVSASRHEGSGYAVIEAMACGVTPCVTNIAPFRVLTAGCGALWPIGDADAGARALLASAARVSPQQREAVRQHFTQHLSWSTLGRTAFDALKSLQDRRQ